jgi:MscS family membrane protein
MTIRFLSIFSWRAAGLAAILTALMIGLWGLSSAIAVAQEAVEPPPVIDEQPEESSDALGRETPRQSINNYLLAADEGDWTTAAEYLDMRNISRAARALEPEELAVRLHIVLQRSGWVDVHGLSDHPEGTVGDGLPDYREELAVVKNGDDQQQLLMQRVPIGGGRYIWKVSNATVTTIPELYSRFGYNKWIEAIAKFIPQGSFLGIQWFKWAIALLVGLVATPIVMAVGWGVSRVLPIKDAVVKDRVRKILMRPITLLIVLVIMRWSIERLGVGAFAKELMGGWTSMILIGTWLMIETVNLVKVVYPAKLIARGRPQAVLLVKPVATTVKSIIIIFAFILWLDNIGVDITALLAGLGVGGVAVALALQRPAEDFLAALTLFTQQPVKVGDFCRVGTTVGTIEEIGLRATKLRTLANSMVTLPNARFASEYIENISSRNKVLFNPIVRIAYRTSSNSMQSVLTNIRDLLQADDIVEDESTWVRYRTIADHSQDIEIFANIKTTVWVDYLAAVELLNLKILDAVESAGASLAVDMRDVTLDQTGRA